MEQLAQIEAGTCDLVYSWCVFHHILNVEAIRAYFSETTRVLAPSGTAVHHFRRRTPYTWIHQTLADLLRLPTPMPKFNRYWRGKRMSDSELDALGLWMTAGTRDFKVIRERLNAWLVILPQPAS